AHGDKPLVGKHGFNHRVGAITARHHHLVGQGVAYGTHAVQVIDDFFACLEALHAAVGLGRRIGNVGIKGKDADDFKTVALAHGVVIEIVCWGDLDHAGGVFRIDVVVRDDGQMTPD